MSYISYHALTDSDICWQSLTCVDGYDKGLLTALLDISEFASDQVRANSWGVLASNNGIGCRIVVDEGIMGREGWWYCEQASPGDWRIQPGYAECDEGWDGFITCLDWKVNSLC